MDQQQSQLFYILYNICVCIIFVFLVRVVLSRDKNYTGITPFSEVYWVEAW